MNIPCRSGFNSSFYHFFEKSNDEILGELVKNQDGSVETTQRDAWRFQIKLLKIYYLIFERTCTF